MIRRYALCLIFASFIDGAFAAAAPVDPANPPQGLFIDEWSEIYFGGGKVGYGHMTMTRDNDVVQTKMTMFMRIGRVDQPVEIEVTKTTTEGLQGRPIAFGSSMKLASTVTTRKGTIQDGKVTIDSSQFGMNTKETYDFPEGAILDAWAAFREGIVRGLKPGTEYTLRIYEPDFRLDGAIEALTKIGEEEDFTYRGKPRRGTKATLTMESPIGTIDMLSWLDDDGKVLQAKVPVAGFEMMMVSVDQQTALSDFVPPEIFMASTIQVNTEIDRARARRIKYRIRALKDEADIGEIPDTGMQRVTSRSDRAVELIVERKKRAPQNGEFGTGASVVVSEYVTGNLMMNTEDPELIALARRAAGGETEYYALADKLRRFVTDYIQDKNLNIGFATASEVCRTKEGDCSEHGVLLAALGRINGLPSRVVVGLAYMPSFGGQKDIFGYHMWTQFFINGEWVDVDAALDETECSPARIAFATSSLKNAGLTDLSLPLISKIGAIDIDVLEIDDRKITSP